MLKPNNLHFLIFLILTVVMIISPIFLLEVLAGVFDIDKSNTLNMPIIEETTLVPSNTMPGSDGSDISRRIRVVVTAYSSSVIETDEEPFITASGEKVRDGIAANNLLPFGTKIRLPEIFGDKTFIIKDRMHSKKGYYHVDIWFPSRPEALEFGAYITEMEVLNY